MFYRNEKYFTEIEIHRTKRDKLISQVSKHLIEKEKRTKIVWQRASGLVNMWNCWESSVLHTSSHVPCSMGFFHLTAYNLIPVFDWCKTEYCLHCVFEFNIMLKAFDQDVTREASEFPSTHGHTQCTHRTTHRAISSKRNLKTSQVTTVI